MNSRRLVCREKSIVRGDGGRVMSESPSRLEARSRLEPFMNAVEGIRKIGPLTISASPGEREAGQRESEREGKKHCVQPPHLPCAGGGYHGDARCLRDCEMHRLRVAPSREPELWQGFARMKTDHHGLSSETPAEVAARAEGK
jgi:hypothetical protein